MPFKKEQPKALLAYAHAEHAALCARFGTTHNRGLL